jgi:hypothetical protein
MNTEDTPPESSMADIGICTAVLSFLEYKNRMPTLISIHPEVWDSLTAGKTNIPPVDSPKTFLGIKLIVDEDLPEGLIKADDIH